MSATTTTTATNTTGALPNVMIEPTTAPAGMAVPEVYTREAMISWLRGEFAAANAIIDVLCNHIAQISGGTADYDPVFAAIHRRRANWLPMLHMQKYFSVDEVAFHLQAVVEKPRTAVEMEIEEEKTTKDDVEMVVKEEVVLVEPPAKGALSVPTDEEVKREGEGDSSSSSSDQISSVDGSGGLSFQEEPSSVENDAKAHPGDDVWICSDHDGCPARPERIKTCKGFTAKEPVKGHMMNVVKGLKMFEDIFIESELLKLTEYINDLRAAGRNGELAGDTFIFFNKQSKGNKREIIQLGVPIFQSSKDGATSTIEPIPSILQNVIDHLVQWRLIPESRKPNGCFINFFDEGDFSQPYFKPPHLDNPFSILFLCKTTLAFGRCLVGNHDGNYRGSLTLPIKEGSLIVMRGNSADMARHVVCSSPNTRVCITFLKVRPSKHSPDSTHAASTPPATATTALWKPGPSIPQPINYVPQAMPPTWTMALQCPPLVMVARPQPMVGDHRQTKKGTRKNGGTGVFLPWAVGPKRYVKHLPPRIQRRRLHSLALPPPLKMQVEQAAAQIPCVAV